MKGCELRKKGYYRIIRNGRMDVSYWSGDKWWTCGNNAPIDDDQMDITSSCVTLVEVNDEISD